jgi:hypothetical protein
MVMIAANRHSCVQERQCPLLADTGLSNVNFKISLLSVCFRPKADVQRLNSAAAYNDQMKRFVM